MAAMELARSCTYCGADRQVQVMTRIAKDGGGYAYACAECAVMLEDAPEDDA